MTGSDDDKPAGSGFGGKAGGAAQPARDPLVDNGQQRPHRTAEIFAIAIAEAIERRQPRATILQLAERAARHGERTGAPADSVLGRFTAASVALRDLGDTADRTQLETAGRAVVLMRSALQDEARARGETRGRGPRGAGPIGGPPGPRPGGQSAPRPPSASLSSGPAETRGAPTQTPASSPTGPQDPNLLSLERTEPDQVASFRERLSKMPSAELGTAIQATYARMVELERPGGDVVQASALRRGVQIALEIARADKPSTPPPRARRRDRGGNER